jgi:hypothetical protein
MTIKTHATREIPAIGDTFYHNMPAMTHIHEITDISKYQDVPDDWWIAITDVRDSTGAIQRGEYKSVNSVAAATITAVLNAIPTVDVPFLFGGDGASIVIPPDLRYKVADSLAAVKRLSKQHFNLELRIGMVPVKDVRAAGYEVKAGKVYMSDNFHQPVFTGGGLDYADKLIKSPETSHLYAVVENEAAEADFSGFECRWSRHRAANGEVVSLLVKAIGGNTDRRHQVYNKILHEIESIYGDQSTRHPIKVEQMRVATDLKQYRNEIAFTRSKVTWWNKLLLMFWAIGGYFIWKYIDKIWDRYRVTVHESTDHEKFDDMLRMTISGTPEQRQQLREYLQIWHDAQQVVFGMHVAEYSLMTCIVWDRFGRQVHFVDADKGGYAMAAKELKEQLRQVGSETLPHKVLAS